MQTREGTLDEFVVNEVRMYLRHLHLTKDDVVLDLGGNIGAFSNLIGGLVSKVIVFEPDEDNFALLQANTSMFPNIECFKEAVVGHNEDEVSFFINNLTNKGAHSLLVKRGRTEVKVKCANIDNVMKRFKPNKIKMDIEGGEYDVVTKMDFTGVDEMIMEYHFIALKDKTKEKYFELVEILKKNFKKVEYKEDPKKAWTTIIYASNL